MTTSSIQQFQTGKTYSTRSICDHNCIFSITVISRTAKTIKIVDPHDSKSIKTLRISEWQGNEQVKPFGSYSMCAIIGADDDKELKPDWAA